MFPQFYQKVGNILVIYMAKIHIFWEDHKNMTKSSSWFDVYQVKIDSIVGYNVYSLLRIYELWCLNSVVKSQNYEILKLIQKFFEPIVLISAEFCKAVIVDEPSH